MTKAPAETDEPEGTSDLEQLLGMEDDLVTLAAVMSAFKTFSWSPHPVEPAGIRVLAQTGDMALEQLHRSWAAMLDRMSQIQRN